MTSFEYDHRATRASVAIALGALLAIAGCDNGGDPDAGVDAGEDMVDAGEDMVDAGEDMMDAGGDDDGGAEDGGGPGDGGVDDGGMPVGGGAATSAQIQAVLDATPGVTSLMVDDAVVTYVKPAIAGGIDGTGFFVQAEQMGPALLVLVDPTGLTPTPTPGQVVDFEVTEVAIDDSTTGGGSNIVYAASIDGWFVDSSGHDTSFLVQDVSAVDLVTNVDDYVGELISLTADIADDFGFADIGFRSAQITTAGVPTATEDLTFRLPSGVLDGSALAAGCTVDIGPTPMWRYTTEAQPSAWRADDFTVTDCPAPTTAGDLVITEIGYQFTGADDAKEFVEIYNPSSDAAFGLDGCILSDEDGPTSGTALTISSGAIVGPGQYVVIAGTVATSEILGDAVLPTGLELGDMDLVQLHCGGTQIDVVDWSTAGFDSTMEEVSIQLDAGLETAASNDDLENWCLTPTTETYGTMGRVGTPGAANPACPCPSLTSGLVLNELDADTVGADADEFIEILNTSGGALELCDVDVVLVNGTNNREYSRVSLGGSVATDGFIVVVSGSSSITPTDASYVTSSIQNGQDGIALVSASTGTVIDFVTYDGTFSSLDVLPSGSGTTPIFTIPTALNDDIGSDSNTTAGSLSRCGTSGTPSADWVFTTTSAGATNSCP